MYGGHAYEVTSGMEAHQLQVTVQHHGRLHVLPLLPVTNPRQVPRGNDYWKSKTGT
jgi:hypothetical protein